MGHTMTHVGLIARLAFVRDGEGGVEVGGGGGGSSRLQDPTIKKKKKF